MRLQGKVAVVTGGGSGLGRASAIALAREGAAVVVGDVDTAGGEQTVEAIVGGGGQASLVDTEVADAARCEALMQAAVDTYGGLHVLHANAGVSLVGQDGPTADMEPAVWDRVISINLSGVFYCCHYALPRMAASGGGSIVNTASSMAHLPLGNMDAYAASKGGVANLTRSMAASAAKHGVRVNAISPGYVETSMTSVIWEMPEVRDAFALGHADGLQTPEEIADVVVFLASNESRSLTGAVLTCDRGWTAFKMPDIVRQFG
ncbi:MAG: SDR family oxidoreductase [Actinobacteria bacterium]|nr:SDR family oxidoreductase [Actinomycetota bacterium]